MVKANAIVIDVGMNRTDDKLVGDVDFESAAARGAKQHAGQVAHRHGVEAEPRGTARDRAGGDGHHREAGDGRRADAHGAVQRGPAAAQVVKDWVSADG